MYYHVKYIACSPAFSCGHMLIPRLNSLPRETTLCWTCVSLHSRRQWKILLKNKEEFVNLYHYLLFSWNLIIETLLNIVSAKARTVQWWTVICTAHTRRFSSFHCKAMCVMHTQACIHKCAHRHIYHFTTDFFMIVLKFLIQRLKTENSNHKPERMQLSGTVKPKSSS